MAEQKKPFTLNSKIEGIYCRAAIMRNPRFNGWTRFQDDSASKIRKGRANALLGCSLAPEPVNGEPHRRLLWMPAPVALGSKKQRMKETEDGRKAIHNDAE